LQKYAVKKRKPVIYVASLRATEKFTITGQTE